MGVVGNFRSLRVVLSGLGNPPPCFRFGVLVLPLFIAAQHQHHPTEPLRLGLDHLPQSPNEIKYIVPGRFVDDFEIMSTMSMKDFFFETPS
jgi:hypothetical protein